MKARTKPKFYRLVPHSADIAIEIWGVDYAQLFANTLLALSDICVGLVNITAQERLTITAAGADYAELLVNFAREGLFLLNARHFAVKKCEVLAFSSAHIHAVISGMRLPSSQPFQREIKAVTYHQSRVCQIEQLGALKKRADSMPGLICGRLVLDV